MAGVLTTSSSIKCAHGATGTATSSAKLKVSGSAVLTSSGVTSWTFVAANCAQRPTQANPDNVPCASMTSQSGGQSQKLKVGGSAVVLDTITGNTNGQPVNKIQVSAGQSKLTAT